MCKIYNILAIYIYNMNTNTLVRQRRTYACDVCGVNVINLKQHTMSKKHNELSMFGKRFLKSEDKKVYYKEYRRAKREEYRHNKKELEKLRILLNNTVL